MNYTSKTLTIMKKLIDEATEFSYAVPIAAVGGVIIGLYNVDPIVQLVLLETAAICVGVGLPTYFILRYLEKRERKRYKEISDSIVKEYLKEKEENPE